MPETPFTTDPLMTELPEVLGFTEAPISLMILSNRRILRVNAEFEAVFGWKRAEIEGRSIRVLYPSTADYRTTGSVWYEHLARQPSHEDERCMQRRDGEIIWLRARGRSLTPSEPFRLTLWLFDPIKDPIRDGDRGAEELTLRERTVARHVATGRTSKEIGQILGISPRTVEVHRAAIMRKLNVNRTAELVSRLFAPGQSDQSGSATKTPSG